MGKHKYIETPDKMWELFEAYRKEVKDNPRYIVDYVGKDGDQVQKPLERPLTLEGFYSYCHKHIGCVKQYIFNQDGLYDEYITISTRVRDEIKNDQVEGGMVGQYNASLTARINGLTDKQEVKQETTIKSLDINILYDGIPLANSEKDIED